MILVTGGAGFIGANFVLDWFDQTDEMVLNLDKLTYAGNPDNLLGLKNDPRHLFVHGDICDAALLHRLLAEHRPRAIINFAAETHVDRSIIGAEHFIQTNVVGTFRLLESARAYWSAMEAREKKDFRFLQVSTDEVYGSLSPVAVAFSEGDRYEPNSPYAASKAAADHLVRAAYRTYGLPVLTTNCANNYGPRQFPEKLIPHMITQALQGNPLPLYGDGLQVRDWLYVSDHCTAVRRVLEAGRPGETYNIGCREERTNVDVVLAICGLLDTVRALGRAGKPLLPERLTSYQELMTHVEDRPGHDVRYAINPDKITAELGWRADFPFEKGICQTVRWYLDHPDWLTGLALRTHDQ
jgi:dTDP-glucose 4,6-dehydratase